MSKAADELREIQIFNGHDVVRLWVAYRTAEGLPSLPGVFLYYRPQQPGRGYHPAAYQVMRPGYNTDPDAFWRDNKTKTFTLFARDERSQALLAAQQWANERYPALRTESGEIEWATIPGMPGDLFPVQTAQWLKAELKKHRSEA